MPKTLHSRRYEPKAASVPYNRPFLDPRDFQNVAQPLRCGRLAAGAQVARFEALVAQRVALPGAVAACSGAAALILALRAAGIGPGQDVLLSAFGDPAGAGAVELCGARPVFCDIDPDTFALDPEEVRRRVTPQTTLVLAAHPFGLPAKLRGLAEVCRGLRLPLIEDCRGGLGGHAAEGHAEAHIGTLGLAGCFDFGPDEALTTGEGGVVVTARSELAQVMRRLRAAPAGNGPFIDPPIGPLMAQPAAPALGVPLSELAAALGVAQVKKLSEVLAERRQVALRYGPLLAPLEWLRRPRALSADSGHAVVCLVEKGLGMGPDDGLEDGQATSETPPREEGSLPGRLLTDLAGLGIECRQPGWAIPRLAYWRQRYHLEAEEFPHALAAEGSLIALPLYVGMSEGEQERVVRALCAAHEGAQLPSADAPPEAARPPEHLEPAA